MKIKLSVLYGMMVLGLIRAQNLLADSHFPGVPERGMMAATLSFDNYTVRVVIAVMVVTSLVGVMLIGGFLIVNLGLMSKRQEDRIGVRNPSDVGILKTSNWPLAREHKNVFPAFDPKEDILEEGDGGFSQDIDSDSEHAA